MEPNGELEKVKGDESGDKKREECQVVIGDEQLEQVDTMKYLGVCNEKWEQGLDVHLELLEE